MSYQDVKDKLYHGHRKMANNTYLTYELLGTILDAGGYHVDEHIDMRLHGNLIAKFHPDYFYLYSAGWYTPTTRNRLNLALTLAKVKGFGWIYQANYQWYYGYQEVGTIQPKHNPKFYDGIKIDYTGKVIN